MQDSSDETLSFTTEIVCPHISGTHHHCQASGKDARVPCPYVVSLPNSHDHRADAVEHLKGIMQTAPFHVVVAAYTQFRKENENIK
jgi:hypothetical protein